MPAMADLGMMAQAAATLRRSEYTALLIKWLDDNLTDELTFVDKKTPWHLRDEFSLAQTLTAIAQLSADDPLCMEIIGLARIEEKVTLLLNKLASIQLSTGMNDSYSHLLPSLLWSSVCLNFSPNEDFTPIALSSALSNLDRIPFSSKVLLAQVCQHLKRIDENSVNNSDIESKVDHL